MKWLHLSDLHFNPNVDGTDSIFLRNNLIKFLKNNGIVVDKIFITGDFRDALLQDDSDENAEIIAKYIFEIADSVGIKDVSNILLVPGNHDINRDYAERQNCIDEIKTNYNTSKWDIPNLDILVNSFEFFKRVLKYVYGENEAINQFENLFKINPHKSNIYNNYNILLMNTELIAGQTVFINGRPKINDEGSLITGSKYIINSLMNMQHTQNPIIAVGHRGLDQLNAAERKKLLDIFKEFNVCLYLCGHSHDLWCDDTYSIPQVTIGCIRHSEGVKAGFSIGEFDEIKNLITVTAFSWDNNCWEVYPHFCGNRHNLVIDLSDKVSIKNNDFNNRITIIIDGRARDFYCKVDHIKFGVEHTNYSSYCTGELICTILNNRYSSLVRVNHRFILSDSVWGIIGVDNTKNGVITLTCEKKQIGPDDDLKLRIAGKNSISDFTIELLAPISNIALSQEIVLKPLLFRDKRQVENADFIIESSDNSIVKVKNESIVGVSLGVAI